ncbi:MAG: hypothetical protein K6G73_12405 [Marinilabiliaceae bacterium]|nr:hypothetical protein [Marinilabiliaceae bacterium]
MLYAPHILQVYREGETQTDEYGRISQRTGEWVSAGICRCDDNTTMDLKSESGREYRSTYHIVAEKNLSIKAGDKIRCLTVDGSIRGEGIANSVKSTNFLNYTEIWL